MLCDLDTALTCHVPTSSDRFAVTADADYSTVSISGTWPGGERFTHARLASPAPSDLNLLLLTPTDFALSQNTGRVPDVSATVSQHADAQLYVISTRFNNT